MKAETEAKLCCNAKDIGQRLSWLQPPSACRNDLSEAETARLDTTVDNPAVERCSIASSHADYGVSKASHGPPILHAVSFVSELYSGEGVFTASTDWRTTKRAS